jgi:CBS domain-containing protein
MKIREIMNVLAVKVGGTTPIRLVAELMRGEGVGVVCICDSENRPVGVITDRDIVTRVCASDHFDGTTEVHKVMSLDPFTCRMEDDVAVVEALMMRERKGRVLVVDEHGELVGIVSPAEICHYQSPMRAGSLSRALSEREYRAPLSGGHTAVGGASQYPAALAAGTK